MRELQFNLRFNFLPIKVIQYIKRKIFSLLLDLGIEGTLDNKLIKSILDFENLKISSILPIFVYCRRGIRYTFPEREGTIGCLSH